MYLIENGKSTTSKRSVIRTIRGGLHGNASSRRYVIEFTCMMGDGEYYGWGK